MAWTFTISVDDVALIAPGMGMSGQMNVIKIACVSDGSGGSCVFKTEDADIFRDKMKGGWLMLMEIDPGTGDDQPAAAFDIDIENKRNHHILDTDSNSHTAASFVAGSDTLGIFPPILNDLTMVIGTLGDGNKADIYLYINR